MSHDSEQHERSALQHDAEHASPGKQRSVMTYLVILFAAAFLLLLLSYFMQQRASRQAYNDLQQSSSSAVQTLDQMLQENEDLKARNADLAAENEDLESQLNQARQEAQTQQQAQAEAGAQVEALNCLSQLRALYNAGKYTQARALLAQWEEASPGGVEAALTQVSAALSDEEREIYDPLAAWQNLNDWLN